MERMIGTIIVLAAAVIGVLLAGCLAPTKSTTTIYNADGTVDRVVESSESVVKTVIDSTKDKLIFVNDQSWLGGLRFVPPGSSAESPMGTLEAVAGKQDKQMLTMPLDRVDSANATDALSALKNMMGAARAGEIRVGPDGIGNSSGGADDAAAR